jgi:thiol:disulfide interchange protein DsbD
MLGRADFCLEIMCMNWLRPCMGVSLLVLGLFTSVVTAEEPGNLDPFAKENEWVVVHAGDPFAKENELTPNAGKAPEKPNEKPAANFTPDVKNPKFREAMPYARATVSPTTARRGETVTWTLTIELKQGYHTYPTQQPENKEAAVTRFLFPKGGDLIPVGTLQEPQWKLTNDNGAPQREIEGKLVFEKKFVVRSDAKPGEKELKVGTQFEICKERICLPVEKLTFKNTVTVTDEPPVPVDNQYQGDVKSFLSGGKDGKKTTQDLLGFILSGFLWGAISLLTPCVFPMIPITVSFFLKQSEKQHHNPLRMAIIYCTTIVVVLTLGAMLLLGFFQAASQFWLTNLVLGAAFVFFALSLFGMYEITLPSGLANFTSARQGKGGSAGTIFMALTFSIISFSCVAPFLGGFAALVPSSGDVLGMFQSGNYASLGRIFGTLLLGALAFSITFASPFFFLALFPSLLRKIPKSGSWMTSIKVVMGFLEIAAAIKFIRAAELGAFGEAKILSYDLALGLYVVIALFAGLYLLGLFRLGHDEPMEHLSVGRMMLSVAFLGFALYLAPGLFQLNAEHKQRPEGVIFAWVDSFLLPDDSDRHFGSLQVALKEAQQQNKLVFVDYTGINCANCKYNEREVFARPEVKELLDKYVIVQLYTDTVPPKIKRPASTASENTESLYNRFKVGQLPLYVILEPDGKDGTTVGQYDEGKINNVDAFEEFLREPLKDRDQPAVAEAR